MKKKRGTGKGRNAAAIGARCTNADLRRLAEAAAAEKTNSGGQRNSGDPANGGSSGSIARPKAGDPANGGTQHPVIEDPVLIVLPSVMTSIPTQYPPSTQRPQLLWRQPLSSRLNPRQSQREEEHHGDYEVDHQKNQVDLPHEEVYQDSEDSDGEEEEEDELVEEYVVDPPEQQDYDQLLDNLMALPGRGHISLLSPHPIPNKDITW
ncbi:hypothetical protein AALP_AAs42446U000100 [Arabis alpina]|nr:hypothetical protein AALP_AAs42446U000100 [Arabis alpina]